MYKLYVRPTKKSDLRLVVSTLYPVTGVVGDSNPQQTMVLYRIVSTNCVLVVTRKCVYKGESGKYRFFLIGIMRWAGKTRTKYRLKDE